MPPSDRLQHPRRNGPSGALLYKGRSILVGPKVALLVAAGTLKQQLGDSAGAKAAFKSALQAADTAGKESGRRPTGCHLGREGSKGVVEVLQNLGDEANAEALAYLSGAQILLGQSDEGENSLNRFSMRQMRSAPRRAHASSIWSGEVLPPRWQNSAGADLDMIEELSDVEVTEQGCRSAAREGDPLYTAAAVARLALAQSTAPRVRKPPTPADAATTKMLGRSARSKSLNRRSNKPSKPARDRVDSQELQPGRRLCRR